LPGCFHFGFTLKISLTESALIDSEVDISLTGSALIDSEVDFILFISF